MALNEMKKSEAFWDSSAGNYDKTEERFETIHRKSRENAKRHLKVGDIVLDYGCGTGTTACEFSNEVKQSQAIYISSKIINLAKEKADTANIENVSFAQGDILTTGTNVNLSMRAWRLTCCIQYLNPRRL